mmetsp:Transcript_89711/g.192293  ORF Transcript_89711/g.192293 Transcript_89711/m.192293 type:complete len:109 (+) Transcript_89711:56-382(+)
MARATSKLLIAVAALMASLPWRPSWTSWPSRHKKSHNYDAYGFSPVEEEEAPYAQDRAKTQKHADSYGFSPVFVPSPLRHTAFSGIVSPEVPKYLMSTVKADDAKAAY